MIIKSSTPTYAPTTAKPSTLAQEKSPDSYKPKPYNLTLDVLKGASIGALVGGGSALATHVGGGLGYTAVVGGSCLAQASTKGPLVNTAIVGGVVAALGAGGAFGPTGIAASAAVGAVGGGVLTFLRAVALGGC